MPVILLMTACQSGTPQPASIEPGDICAFCKMSVSQPAYAAQFIDKDGSNFKFDDVGCMIRFAREDNRRSKVAAFFVMDYNDHHWLPAERATYVKSEKTASPMGSGLVGFRDSSGAKDFAGKKGGRVLLFDDLWKGDVAEPQQVPTKPR
jgi:copper chaperone NosL